MVDSLTTDSDALKSYYENQAARNADLARSAKELCNKLVAAGVDVVSADYDGCGDSGQIENLGFYASAGAGGSPIELPEALCSEVEELLYDLLAARHGGWDIGEGSYGSFSWSLATESMEHEHNDRFTDVETSKYVGFGIGPEQPGSDSVEENAAP